MSDTKSNTTADDQADHDRIAEAVLKRLEKPKLQDEEALAELRFEQERPIRQKFRRLADPGIIRNNNNADTKRTFEVLLKLSQNLLSDPENPKFKEFKSTNLTIQRALIDPKGAIEYAIEMGFRASVQEFQPKYVWHSTPENLAALRIGAEIIREHSDLAAVKQERSSKNKMTAAEEKSAAVQKALLAFEDDRKSRKLLDARMKERGHAPMSPMRLTPAPSSPPQSPQFKVQGSGDTLGGPSARRAFISEDDDTTVAEEKPLVDDSVKAETT